METKENISEIKTENETEELSEKDIHKKHRIRAKTSFLRDGFDETTPPHTMLELLLFYVIPQKDTNPIAHALIEKFNDVSGVLTAPVEELIKVPGITPNGACLIKSILPIANRYFYEADKRKHFIVSKDDAREFLFRRFLGVEVETVYMLSIDNKAQILSCKRIAEGSDIAVSVSSKTILEEIVRTNAAAIMLAHNHPRGYAFPSPADIRVTMDIAKTLRYLDVMFMDHIIIADADYVSMIQSKDYKYIFEGLDVENLTENTYNTDTEKSYY